MKIPKFWSKQMVDLADQQAIAELLQAGMAELVKNAVYTDDFTLLSGLTSAQAATPNGTIQVAVGKALHAGHLISIDTPQTMNIVSGSSGWGTAQAAHATYSRIDIVCLQYATQDTDVVSKTFVDDSSPDNPTEYSQSVATRVSDYYAFTVVHGTAAASPVAPATPAGYVKLCEVTVPANATTITNSNIASKLPVAVSTLTKVFTDLKTHAEAAVLAHPDGSVNDTKIGNRTADPAISTAFANTGTITQLFSWITKAIKAAVGGTNWYTAPTRTLEAVNTLAESASATAGSAATAITNHTSTGATTSSAGHIALATAAEVTAGTVTDKAVVPSTLKTELDKKATTTALGTTNQNVTDLGTDVGNLSTALSDHVDDTASETAVGHIQLATSAEVTAGTNTLKAVTPATLLVELLKKASLSGAAFTGQVSVASATDVINLWFKNSATLINQIFFGEALAAGVIGASISTGYSTSDLYLVHNAYQSSKGADMWTQNHSSYKSILLRFAYNDGLYYHEAVAGKAAGNFVTFWGTGYPILSGTVPVANGGTGQTTLAAARNAMGLGNTTGALPVANGGTGAATAAAALTALGLTATAAEINAGMDGLTATAAEINILDGVTGVSAAEISYLANVTSDIQTQLNAKSALNPSVVSVSASKTLALTDTNTFQSCSSTSAIVITIPADASVAFSTGTEIAIYRHNTGAVSVSPASGVTLLSSGSKRSIKNQSETACLKKISSNTWVLAGSLA